MFRRFLEDSEEGIEEFIGFFREYVGSLFDLFDGQEVSFSLVCLGWNAMLGETSHFEQVDGVLIGGAVDELPSDRHPVHGKVDWVFVLEMIELDFFHSFVDDEHAVLEGPAVLFVEHVLVLVGRAQADHLVALPDIQQGAIHVFIGEVVALEVLSVLYRLLDHCPQVDLHVPQNQSAGVV